MKNTLNNELGLITDAGIRKLVEQVLDKCPQCFWSMPAATTGKYHPAISLGEGGLVRHTKAVVRLVTHLCNMVDIGATHPHYSLLVAAAILHDCCKKRDDEMFTAFDHPLRAAELIERVAGELESREPGTLQPSATRTLSAMVASHMGRWNTDARHGHGTTLPLPVTPLQRILHTADYLASRKDLTLAGIAEGRGV